MAVAGQGLDTWGSLEGLFAPRGPRKRGALVGTGVALVIHVAVAVALVQVDTAELFRAEKIVEMDVQEPKPPPPEVRPEPPPPPPAPEPKPRIVMHRAPAAPPPEAPPPPSEAPKAGEAPPVFGVTMGSVVAGDGPGMAVPVGNTLMAKPHKAAPPAAPVQAAGDGDGLPAAVPEVFISEQPKVLHEVTAAYPPDMQRLGIEGHVVAKLYVDEEGNVRRVKITEPAGHGFDELAKEALKKFKFSPARTSDGKAVPTNIVYKYTFVVPQ